MLLDAFKATAASSTPEVMSWLWPPQRLLEFPILVVEGFCVPLWKIERGVVRSLEAEDLER